MKSEYRPCVAALVENAAGLLLVAERQDIPESWQFPQGGIDPGETPRIALIRELGEELSLQPQDVEVLEEKGGYRYDFPAKHRRWGKYLGQEQTYFRCRLLSPDSAINLETAHPEFRSWKWIRPEEFRIKWLPPFKRPVYEAVLRDFYGVDLTASARNL
jgi:putative (di)nucleoside polyphosphate hydrolase